MKVMMDKQSVMQGSAETRGTNQTGMRALNERLVLTLIRRHGALAKSEIARATSLSAQTVSVIMRSLEEEGLLLKGEPHRGKVGQPSVPMRLNPSGAYFFGLKIGRRSVELILIDFLGEIISRRGEIYTYPDFDNVLNFAVDAITSITAEMEQNSVARIAGLGIAIPFQLWHWPRLLGIDSANMDAWRLRDIQAEIAANFQMPVFLQNDATAACSSELVFGTADLPGNFLQFYLASFIGGGVVLNGSLFAGPTGNAGAIGSMLVPNSDGRTSQLIDLASLVVLEDMLVKSNHDPSSLWVFPHGWEIPNDIRQEWLLQAGKGIAYATHSATAVFDFEAICIDGWMPEDLRADLIAVIDENLNTLDFTGLHRPRLVRGTTGANARALGAASQPLLGRFLMPLAG